ncbi:MAG: TlpA family protein disulfide reductase [Chloroflexi bacterium]|nr:TlpA family protein disulfide reductase [Chloroflexota bacterium]
MRFCFSQKARVMQRFFVVFIIMLSLSACSSTNTRDIPANLPDQIGVNATLTQASTIATVDQPAPAFTWRDAQGTTRQLADYRGQRVILNMWATWCEPCRSEMPDLDRVHGRNDVVVIGINKGQNIDVIPPFIDEIGVSFPLISDPDGDVSLAYGVRNLPTSVFIDREGFVRTISIGILSADALTLQLERLP